MLHTLMTSCPPPLPDNQNQNGPFYDIFFPPAEAGRVPPPQQAQCGVFRPGGRAMDCGAMASLHAFVLLRNAY